MSCVRLLDAYARSEYLCGGEVPETAMAAASVRQALEELPADVAVVTVLGFLEDLWKHLVAAAASDDVEIARTLTVSERALAAVVTAESIVADLPMFQPMVRADVVRSANNLACRLARQVHGHDVRGAVLAALCLLEGLVETAVGAGLASPVWEVDRNG